MLDAGGQLEVVIPAAKYRAGLPDEAKPAYDELLVRARRTHMLDHIESTEQAHMDASVEMIKRADQLFAVWDGQPPAALAARRTWWSAPSRKAWLCL